MKKFSLFLLFILFAGSGNSYADQVLTFDIDPRQSNVPNTAGDFTVNISILNPLWNDKWTVTIPVADNWVKLKEQTSNKVVFSIEANESDKQRKTAVEIKMVYEANGGKTVIGHEFSLTQAGTATQSAALEKNAIPDGTATELLDYVERQVWKDVQVPDDEAERRKMVVEKRKHILEVVNVALERVTPGEVIKRRFLRRDPTTMDVRTELLKEKSYTLRQLNDYAEGYTEMYLDFIAELEHNPADREVARIARGAYLYGLIADLGFRKKVPITRENFSELQKRVLDFLKDEDADKDSTFYIHMTLDLLLAAIRLADQENDRRIALETAELCTTIFENAKLKMFRYEAYRPMAILNEHYLPQDGLQIQGKLFDGKAFDIAEYRGRPMLVVFWCSDPEAGENPSSSAHASNLLLPQLKKIYEQYHGQGLEIVGVCTNRNVMYGLSATEEKLQMIAEHARKTAEALPWKIHVSDKLTIEAGLPSNVKRYDHVRDEHIFFLDAEGKILHQQRPDGVDVDFVRERGGNPASPFNPKKYQMEELEQKIKDYFSK